MNARHYRIELSFKKCLHRHQIVKHVNNDVGLFMILYSKCYRTPNDYNRSKLTHGVLNVGKH